MVKTKFQRNNLKNKVQPLKSQRYLHGSLRVYWKEQSILKTIM